MLRHKIPRSCHRTDRYRSQGKVMSACIFEKWKWRKLSQYDELTSFLTLIMINFVCAHVLSIYHYY